MSKPTLSVVLATYGQPNIWKWHWDELVRLKDPSRIELVIVDDCGNPPMEIPEHIREEVPVKLFRVLKNIPWNQMGARNLGMKHCSAPVAVMLDPDMVPTPIVWEEIIWAAETLEKGKAIKFSLMKADGKKISSSPNTWIIHTSDFWDIGGYDEDYAGNKGWSDVALLHTINSRFKIVHRPDIVVPYVLIEDGVSDAQVISLDRSVRINAKKHRQMASEVNRRFGGNWAKWARAKKKETLRFPWKRVL